MGQYLSASREDGEKSQPLEEMEDGGDSTRATHGNSTVFTQSRTYGHILKFLTRKDEDLHLFASGNRASSLGPGVTDKIGKDIHLPKAMEVYQKRLRQKFDQDLCTYLTFLVLVIVLSCWIAPVSVVSEHVDSGLAFFSSENNPNYVDFNSVSNRDKVYEFLEKTIAEGLIHDYNSLFSSQVVIGGVLLRQIRVKPSTCHVKGLDTVCYDFFHPHNIDKSPFGPATEPGKYTWTDGYPILRPSSLRFRDAHSGMQQSYGTGAHAIVMSLNSSQATELIKELKSDGWINDSTRVVAVNFGVINSNLGYASSFEYSFDISPSFYIEPVSRVYSYSISSFTESSFQIFLAFFILRLAMECLNEAIDLYEDGYRVYFKMLWNWIESLANILFLAVSSLALDIVSKTGDLSNQVEEYLESPEVTTYIDFQTLGFHHYFISSLIGLGCFLAFFKVFKYLRIYRRFNVIWTTMSEAGIALLSFTVIFSVVLVAYTFFGYFAFGSYMRGYNNFAVSVLTTFQMLSGNIEYETYLETHPILTYLYLVSYMIFVFLILVNMFIAILSKYYEDVHQENRIHEEQAGAGQGSGAGSDEIPFPESVSYDFTQRFEEIKPRILFDEEHLTHVHQGDYIVVHKTRTSMKENSKIKLGKYSCSHIKIEDCDSLFQGQFIHFKCIVNNQRHSLSARKVDLESLSIEDKATMQDLTDLSRVKPYIILEALNDVLISDSLTVDIPQYAVAKLVFQVFVEVLRMFVTSHCQVFVNLLHVLGFCRKKTDGGFLSDKQVLAVLDTASRGGSASTSRTRHCRRLRFFELVREIISYHYITLSASGVDDPNYLGEAIRIMLLLHESSALIEPKNKADDTTTDYHPDPLFVSGNRVAEYAPVVHGIAAEIHDAWTVTKLGEGWIFGTPRNDSLKIHPLMKPFDELTEEEKSYDRMMTLQVILNSLSFACSRP
eukprot:TRINITY_DN3413_c0_g2_i1.p1 TRINITY_DN3413_c0_g2~~TRINITY_DN3413_c0_g2_i1.p1  ORF type:complete len:947 (-),score=177.36 TRINITY_DN3413_c0_g2_i1:665-3505(-)